MGGDKPLESNSMTDVLNEHLKINKDGILEGLYTIDTQKGSFTHLDIWDKVDQIVEEYTRLHPQEMEIIVRENILISANNFNKFGSSTKDGKIELHGHRRFPVGLLRTLETFAPELFDNKKNYHKLQKRFKGLCAYGH